MRLVDIDAVLDLFGISDSDIYVKGTINDAVYDGTLKIYTQPKKGKWIPCSESLPGEKDSIFAGLYGTPKWNKSMFRKRSQRVLVTVVYPNGKRGVDVNHTTDGEWYKDPLSKAWDVKTVAWMPFPEPLEGDTDEGSWYHAEDIRQALEEVPAAQPEKEKAKRVLWTGWKGCRDTRYKCPNCKKPVKNDDVYCHRCGQKLMFPHVSWTPYVEGQIQELIVRWDDEVD